jgi:hypothetical protein
MLVFYIGRPENLLERELFMQEPCLKQPSFENFSCVHQLGVELRDFRWLDDWQTGFEHAYTRHNFQIPQRRGSLPPVIHSPIYGSTLKESFRLSQGFGSFHALAILFDATP